MTSPSVELSEFVSELNFLQTLDEKTQLYGNKLNLLDQQPRSVSIKPLTK